MKTSDEGKKAIINREGGLKLKAYKDTGGVWTIGAGNTSYMNKTKVMPGDQITPAEAYSLFTMKLPYYESAVNKLVRVPLNQKQFDSLVSLVWNIGPARFAASKLLKYINSKQPPELISKAFVDTVVTVKGVKSKGLINRRLSEVKQFYQGHKKTGNFILIIAGGLLLLYLVSK